MIEIPPNYESKIFFLIHNTQRIVAASVEPKRISDQSSWCAKIDTYFPADKMYLWLSLPLLLAFYGVPLPIAI